MNTPQEILDKFVAENPDISRAEYSFDEGLTFYFKSNPTEPFTVWEFTHDSAERNIYEQLEDELDGFMEQVWRADA